MAAILERINFSTWVKEKLVFQKLSNPLGIAIIILLAIILGYTISKLSIIYSLLVLVGIVGLPVIFLSLVNQQVGVAVMLCIAFTLQLITKYTNAPIGTLMDSLVFLMLLIIFIKQIKERDWSFCRGPISVVVLMWIYYNLAQVLNPIALSKLAWLYTVRSVAGLLLFYFVCCYAFSTKERVFWAVKFVLFWLFVSALWGLKQEYIGMSDAEMKWLMSDKERFQLMFQWTRFRIFSMFSDATTFGIMMAYTCVWCIIIIAGPAKTFSKILAGIAFLSMLLTSAYSGTRTAYVLIPAGFLMWTMLAMNRNMLLIIGFFMLIGTAAMMKSTSNALIYRIQSAFKPTKDNSVLVRIKNQKFIQPYIQSHPIGFGLGSCGIWGKRFTPDSWLANFPHDSGYVRMAVELGWVGLILNLIFLFVIMRTGIYYYFRVRDPMIKNIYLGLCVCIFCMILANYPQEAIIQLPNSIVFYTMLAVLTRLKDFDTPITDGTIIEVKNNQDNYKRGQ